MALWIAMSAGMHVALILGWGARGAGLFTGAGLRDGDGFAGTSVEFEIAGTNDDTPRGGSSAGAAPTVAEPVLEERAAPRAEAGSPMLDGGDVPVRVERGAERATGRQNEERAGNSTRDRRERRPSRSAARHGDPTAREVAAAGGAQDPAGTGADDSTAGVPAGDARSLILGAAGVGDSVAARRALLPNGGACSDPVAGTWRAQKYRGYDRTWVRFILRIRRQGDALSGTITSRIWTGTPSDPQPGACTPTGFDHTWRMDARGSVDGTRVTFGSRTARLVEAHCPSPDRRYAPDNFSGTIRPLGETYESVNNDGAFDIDEPYTFRRISCE